MFKVINGALKIGNYMSVFLQNGEHKIYINKNNSSIVQDYDGDEDKYLLLATYNYSEETGSLSIKKEVSDFNEEIKSNWFFGRSMWNNRRVHSGPLYSSPDIPISGYLTGLPIDFDYRGFVIGTLSLATYTWVGGRICFDAGLLGGGGSSVTYTGKGIAPCGVSPYIELYTKFGPMTFGLSGLSALSSSASNFQFNRISHLFFLYSHRRYYDIQINKKEIYCLKDKTNNKIDISAPYSGDENEETTMPNLNANLSMFNLMQ